MHVTTEHALRSSTNTSEIMHANHRPSDHESAIFKMFVPGVQTPAVSRVRLPPETTVNYTNCFREIIIKYHSNFVNVLKERKAVF